MKKVLLFSLALVAVGAISAQEYTFTYNANTGTSTLGAGAAAKVYMHSGAGELGPWEAVVGNWGSDDGVGEMTESSDDIWEITLDPAVYYGDVGYAGPVPPPHIGIVFRNEDGTLEGKGYDNDGDGNADDIFAVYNETTSSYDITCDCLTIEEKVVQSIDNNIAAITDLNVGPNPFASNVTFRYTLDRSENVIIAVYNMMGQEVATIINETQVAGAQVITWNGADVPAGNYIVRMTVGNQTNAGSIVKL